MREYDEITLQKVQKAELSILKDFISLCDNHGITYFGIAGTGIGALRHGGFIPWDDDIDIAMPRKDFNRFVEVAKREYNDRYMVMNGEENENYPLLTTRWMLRGTEFIEHPLRNIDCPLGIFLDIYPLDQIPDDDRLFKKQARKAFFFSKLLILRSISDPVLPFSGVMGKVVRCICFLVHHMMRLTGVSKRWLYQKCLEISTMYNDLDATKRIDFLCDTTAYMNIHYVENIFPLKKIKFEDVMLNFPCHIEENLTLEYGDYMTLPPIEKRRNHYPYSLNFGDIEFER